jgi:YD repeat-containing protein
VQETLALAPGLSFTQGITTTTVTTQTVNLGTLAGGSTPAVPGRYAQTGFGVWAASTVVSESLPYTLTVTSSTAGTNPITLTGTLLLPGTGPLPVSAGAQPSAFSPSLGQTTAITESVTGSAYDPTFADTTISVSGVISNTQGQKVASLATLTTPSGGWTWNGSGASTGVYTLTVTAADGYGDQGNTSLPLYVLPGALSVSATASGTTLRPFAGMTSVITGTVAPLPGDPTWSSYPITLTVTIKNSGGMVVRTLDPGSHLATNTWRFDGTDGQGNALPPGSYTATIAATAQAQQTTLTGSTTVALTVTSPGGGTVPWHPHHDVTLSDSLSLGVDLADGHVDLRAADMSVAGRGPDLSVAHTWDSAWATSTESTNAGQGWLTNLDVGMTGVLTQTVWYTDGTGATWPFTYTGNLTDTGTLTAYETPPGLPWQLSTTTITGTVGYTLSNVLTNETLTFAPSGQLVADTDAYRNTNTLNAAATSWANSNGRNLAISYTSKNLLNDLQSPLWQSGGSGAAGSQHVTYTYGSSGCASTQLCSLVRGSGTSDARTAKFGYTGNLLTSITTPLNQTWSLGYNSIGQLITITSPVSGTSGQGGYTPAYTTKITYNTGTTILVEGSGTTAAITTTYTLDGQGEATSIFNGIATTHAQYDPDHDVIQSIDGNTNPFTNTYLYVGATTGLTNTVTGQPLLSTGLISQTTGPVVGVNSLGAQATPDQVQTTYLYTNTGNIQGTDPYEVLYSSVGGEQGTETTCSPRRSLSE